MNNIAEQCAKVCDEAKERLLKYDRVSAALSASDCAAAIRAKFAGTPSPPPIRSLMLGSLESDPCMVGVELFSREDAERFLGQLPDIAAAMPNGYAEGRKDERAEVVRLIREELLHAKQKAAWHPTPRYDNHADAFEMVIQLLEDDA